MPFTGSKNCSIVFVSMKACRRSASKIGRHELPVFLGVRRVGVVEADEVALPVALVGVGHAGDELLGRDALGFRLEHDRRPVRVVGADERDLVPLQPLETHPDVGLHVLHHVADVQRPVGVWKRRR
jgi:hypothetical protein